MKTTLSLLALFLVILAGGYLYSSIQTNIQSAPASYSLATTTQADATSTPTVRPSVPIETSGSPAVSAPTTPAVSGYTLASIASHNTSKSCWTAINGNVYDLTKRIAEHPGGQGGILSICGKDGSQAFNTQHGGSAEPAAVLERYKLGALSQ